MNVKLMTGFKVDGMSSKLTFELDVDAMRLKCDFSSMLQRIFFLNMLSTLALTFCKTYVTVDLD